MSRLNEQLKCKSLFIFLTLISTGYALQCYVCKSEKLYECRQGSAFVGQVTCGLEHPNFLRFCLQRIIFDKMLLKFKVHMGCDLIGKHERITEVDAIPQCDSWNKTRYELRECKMCFTDLCSFNGAPKHSLKILFFPILIFLNYFL